MGNEIFQFKNDSMASMGVVEKNKKDMTESEDITIVRFTLSI